MKSFLNIWIYAITATAVICVLSSCEDRLKAVQKMELVSNAPIGEVTNMVLKHTDSGLIKIQMKGEKMRDFSNDSYPYTEFPKGVDVTIYEHRKDSTMSQTHITADYGVLYDEPNLVDLKGNVVITNPDGSIFKGDQLYWDQNEKWIFTNHNFTIYTDNATNSGSKLDANEDLTKITIRDANSALPFDKL